MPWWKQHKGKRWERAACSCARPNSSFTLLQGGGVRKRHVPLTPQTKNASKGGTEFGKMHLLWLLQVECDSCSVLTQSREPSAATGVLGQPQSNKT